MAVSVVSVSTHTQLPDATLCYIDAPVTPSMMDKHVVEHLTYGVMFCVKCQPEWPSVCMYTYYTRGHHFKGGGIYYGMMFTLWLLTSVGN